MERARSKGGAVRRKLVTVVAGHRNKLMQACTNLLTTKVLDLGLGAIPIVASQRQTALPERWLSEQHLVDVQTTTPESMGRASHVEAPYAIGGVTGDTARLVGMGL